MKGKILKENVDNILNNPYTNPGEKMDEVMQTFPLDDLNYSGCDLPVDGLGPKTDAKVYKIGRRK